MRARARTDRSRWWGLAMAGAVALWAGCDGGSSDDDAPSDDPGPGNDDSSYMPPSEGAGCGIVPACDRGELVMSVKIESSADIDLIAGYTSLTGELQIDNTDLVCLDFLACLEGVGIDLTIFGNEQLADLSGLNNLRALGTQTANAPFGQRRGSLIISDNAGLRVLNGLDSLLQTQQSLLIADNPNLVRIDGFADFIVVQRDFTIRANPNLVTIPGLADLKAVGGEFVVVQNPNLCESDVNAIGAALEEGPNGGLVDFNGEC